MPHIQQLTLRDRRGDFPNMTPYNGQIGQTSETKVLVAGCGFEDRATAIVGKVAPNTFDHAILLKYATNHPDNARASEPLSGLSKTTPVEVQYSLELSRDVSVAISAIPNVDAALVVLDVSAIASFAIFSILDAIFQLDKHIYLSIFYAEAVEYDPSQAKWTTFANSIGVDADRATLAQKYESSDKFESRGVSDVYVSPLYPGKSDEASVTRVIMIPSFSFERAQRVVEFCEDQFATTVDEFTWFVGSPPDLEKNGWRREAMEALYRPLNQAEAVFLDTREYWECLRRLEEEWSVHAIAKRLMIYANGSKMQHLAVSLFLQMHPEVGLVLSEPQTFSAGAFSSGVGDVWYLAMGPVSRILRDLRSIGDLEFQWG